MLSPRKTTRWTPASGGSAAYTGECETRTRRAAREARRCEQNRRPRSETRFLEKKDGLAHGAKLVLGTSSVQSRTPHLNPPPQGGRRTYDPLPPCGGGLGWGVAASRRHQQHQFRSMSQTGFSSFAESTRLVQARIARIGLPPWAMAIGRPVRSGSMSSGSTPSR